MATIEHCLFCFEVLASHLQNRKPMTLAEVEKSWQEYVVTAAATDTDSSKLAKRLPALRRLAESSPSGSSSPASSSTPSGSSSTTSLQAQQGSGVSTPATSVSSSSTPSLAAVAAGGAPTPDSPLFITWNTLSSRHGHVLRGCIGTFEAQEIEDGLSSYALTSALHDTRFPPISARELPTLQACVTLLTDFEDAEDAMDWELGKHGIRISFYYHDRRYGATYLPDVATEQGWTKEETMVSLMRKAGWMGRKDKWQEVDIKVVRYQGKRESLDWDEYERWKDWVASK